MGDRWDVLLRRYGFRLRAIGSGIDLGAETDGNIAFLGDILRSLGSPGVLDVAAKRFVPSRPGCSPDEFVRAFRAHQVNVQSGSPHDLRILEPHVAALVRVLNDLGFTTVFSCEGHLDGQAIKSARIIFPDTASARGAAARLADTRLYFRVTGRALDISTSFPVRRVAACRGNPDRDIRGLWDGLLFVSETQGWCQAQVQTPD